MIKNIIEKFILDAQNTKLYEIGYNYSYIWYTLDNYDKSKYTQNNEELQDFMYYFLLHFDKYDAELLNITYNNRLNDILKCDELKIEKIKKYIKNKNKTISK
jgi:hypothetical protein